MENQNPDQENTSPEQALADKVEAVKNAQTGSSDGIKLPTGNDVEKNVLKDLNPSPAPGKKGAKNGETRRNYRDYVKTEEEKKKEDELIEPPPEPEPEVEVDTLTPKLNAIALMATNIPFLKNKFGKKDPKKVMYTPDQEEQLRKMLPPSAFGKKTMFDYWMTATSMLIVNFMSAPVIKDEIQPPTGKDKNLQDYIQNMTPEMRQMFKDELSKHP